METAVVPAPVAAVPSDGAAAGPGFQASPAGSAGQRARGGKAPARLRPRGGFGGYLYELRHERGLTARHLAAAAGVHHTYVSKLERGDRQAPEETVVEALAEAVGASPAQLDQLRWRAGLAPRGAGAPGQDDPTLTLVAEALGDPALTDRERDLLRQGIAHAARLAAGLDHGAVAGPPAGPPGFGSATGQGSVGGLGSVSGLGGAHPGVAGQYAGWPSPGPYAAPGGVAGGAPPGGPAMA